MPPCPNGNSVGNAHVEKFASLSFPLPPGKVLTNWVPCRIAYPPSSVRLASACIRRSWVEAADSSDSALPRN